MWVYNPQTRSNIDHISHQLALQLAGTSADSNIQLRVYSDRVITRTIRSRTTNKCYFPKTAVSGVNRELLNILMKHKTANFVIFHVEKSDIQQ